MFNYVKPLKRSEKVRLRKELEKRKKEEQNNPKLPEVEPGYWKLTWEQIKEMF
jgi:hypothetical protein